MPRTSCAPRWRASAWGWSCPEEQVDPQRQAELTKDIAELDQLIDEILLASRLDAIADLEVNEDIDLLALAAEECAHYEDCSLDGMPVIVRGDPRLLRRMIRNLLENARRHGAPPVAVDVRQEDGRAVLRVRDQGPSIAPVDRERLFAPFFRMAGAAGGAGLGPGAGAADRPPAWRRRHLRAALL